MDTLHKPLDPSISRSYGGMRDIRIFCPYPSLNSQSYIT